MVCVYTFIILARAYFSKYFQFKKYFSLKHVLVNLLGIDFFFFNFKNIFNIEKVFLVFLIFVVFKKILS